MPRRASRWASPSAPMYARRLAVWLPDDDKDDDKDEEAEEAALRLLPPPPSPSPPSLSPPPERGILYFLSVLAKGSTPSSVTSSRMPQRDSMCFSRTLFVTARPRSK